MTVERVGETILSFLDDRFEPVPPDRATLVKVVRPDGTVVFARPRQPLGKSDDAPLAPHPDDPGQAAQILLVRHGKTAYNLGGVGHDRIRGHTDVPLDPEGWREAHALGIRLQGEPLTAVLTSDLSRAADTADAIAAQHPGLQARRVPDLRSWNLGDLEGRLASGAVVRRIEALVHHPDETPPGGGETFRAFAARVAGVLDGLTNEADPGDRIAVVTHARDIQLLEKWLEAGGDLDRLHGDFAEALATEPDTVRPGGFVRLMKIDGRWAVVERHLEAERSTARSS